MITPVFFRLGAVMLVMAGLVVPATSRASMLAVQSTTDSNGLFTYTVLRGPEPYVWGGSNATLSLAFPVLGMQSASASPGWSVTSTAAGVIWSYTGAVTWLVDTAPAIFAVSSALVMPVAYDSLATTALYQQGTLLGDVFGTNQAPYPRSVSGEVSSVNVTGYERFSFIGPALPEPFLVCALAVLGALGLRRARRHYGVAAGVALAALLANAQAADGRLCLQKTGSNVVAQVQGSDDDDWRLQISTDLLAWSNMASFGTLLSGGTNAPWRATEAATAARCFYRARKTDGLYDVTVLRTIWLTFAQANWQALLVNCRLTGSNTIGSLVMDNGAAMPCIGARYKGNTSYTGLGGTPPTKKSINVEVDFTNDSARVMGYKTLNFNNAYGDETIMREPIYFDVMQKYTVCPKGSFAKVYINGAYWGLYSFAQQENNQLINEWFPRNDGDRWKAPNMATGGGPGSSASALSYLGSNWFSYTNNYELKTQNSSNPWVYLIHTTDVLNNTPTNQLRDKAEEVMAVDRWLWFLAIENIFTDEDSYHYKGADYGFYYEPESGRIHPVEHDGNESFTAGDVTLSPVYGYNLTTRPVLYRFLSNAELRQRYLAHMRTVLQESFNPSNLYPLILQHSALTYAAIAADTKKDYTAMATYTNDMNALRTFITNRYVFLTTNAALRPLPPNIIAVLAPTGTPTAAEQPTITANVLANGANGLDSVWLYHRGKAYGRFISARMYDDGAHGDGAAGDAVFGAATSNYSAGAQVRYYVEARSANSAKAACFSPARAEQETYNYRVGLISATNTAVVINECMADNATTMADPQGEYDDWLELRNITDHAVDLTGLYLSDDRDTPRKWPFPAGTTIPADGFLLVWADEDGTATPGLHANFKLSKSGESILLTDTDAHLNATLDSITFGTQQTDISYGRTAEDADIWSFMSPTPGAANN